MSFATHTPSIRTPKAPLTIATWRVTCDLFPDEPVLVNEHMNELPCMLISQLCYACESAIRDEVKFNRHNIVEIAMQWTGESFNYSWFSLVREEVK
jgi:hypothetical protein